MIKTLVSVQNCTQQTPMDLLADEGNHPNNLEKHSKEEVFNKERKG